MARINVLLPVIVLPLAFILGTMATNDAEITDGVIHGYYDPISLESRMIKATMDEYLIIARVTLGLAVTMGVLLTLILVGRWVRNNRGISLE